MQDFELQLNTRVIFGPDSLERVGGLANEWGAHRALLVTDQGIAQAGHAERAERVLRKASIEVATWSQVIENPTTVAVAQATEFAREFRPDLLIGLGGGSSMDTAKGVNFLLTNGGQMSDYWGVGKAKLPMLPSMAIPTTAGTGSETQSFALVSDAVTHVKMACGDKKAAFKAAVLDPKLTLSQPPRVTALTGLDAISHALETYVTTKRTAVSRMFSLEAWKQLAVSFPRVIADPLDLQARSGMQWGACLAGLAIEHSMLGATHALANPLTANYGQVHGQAIGLMLPHVIRFNAAVCEGAYAELLVAVDRHVVGESGAALAALVAEFRELAGIPARLSTVNVPADALDRLAEEASKQWTLGFNPRPVIRENLRELYAAAW